MSIPRLKLYMYIALGIMGLLLLFMAFAVDNFNQTRHFATNFLTSLFIGATGLGLCVFSITTILLRDDPDIWR